MDPITHLTPAPQGSEIEFNTPRSHHNAKLPLMGWDAHGAPIVLDTNTGELRYARYVGTIMSVTIPPAPQPAPSCDHRPTDIVTAIPGTTWFAERVLEDGSRASTPLIAWGITRGGEAIPLAQRNKLGLDPATGSVITKEG